MASTISQTPLSEFDTDSLATMALPTLFPYGTEDPTTKNRDPDVSFSEFFKHIRWFAILLYCYYVLGMFHGKLHNSIVSFVLLLVKFIHVYRICTLVTLQLSCSCISAALRNSASPFCRRTGNCDTVDCDTMYVVKFIYVYRIYRKVTSKLYLS